MIRLALILGVVTVLGACTTPAVYDYTPQYCYTDQTIERIGDIVNSETKLECTDRPGQQVATQRAGIDKGCKEFWYTESRQGNLIQQRGVYCEKLDGSVEIINIDGNNS